MRVFRSIAKKIIGVAEWYMRRRRITKALIFILFLLPFAIYSYWEANLYMNRYTVQTLVVADVNTTLNLNLSTISCNSLFRWKTLYIFGTLSIPRTCYVVNNSTYLFTENGRVTEIIVSGDISKDVAYVMVLPVNTSITIENTRLHVSKMILVVNGGNYTDIQRCLVEYNLTSVFCRTAKPSKLGWSRDTVPERLFDSICLSGNT